MDKKNLLIIAALLLAAALLAGASLLAPRPADVSGDTVIITVDGREYARVPLSQKGPLTIRQENGAVNTLLVTENGVLMQSSTCQNQLCVHMGEVTREDWRYRPNQQFIVCLPNRVSVELVVVE